MAQKCHIFDVFSKKITDFHFLFSKYHFFKYILIFLHHQPDIFTVRQSPTQSEMP